MASFSIDVRKVIDKNIDYEDASAWEFSFQDSLPSPFASWVPATSVKLSTYTIEDEKFDLITFPSGISLPKLSISYIDDENLTVSRYINSWINEIVSPDGSEVAALSECLRTVHFTKLKRDRQTEVVQFDAEVYPTSSIDLSGSNKGDIPERQVDFVIVKYTQTF